MKITIVDDEISSVEMLSSVLRELKLEEDIEIISFTSPSDAYDYLTSNKTDIVFLDIEMPAISGLDIAGTILDTFADPPEIIFVTAYPQYSLDAWKYEAVDYILKPYDPVQVEKALKRSLLYQAGKKQQTISKPYIRCFSEFDVMVNGKSVIFTSRRSKELLAFLVHHRGSWVGINKLSYELLEEAPETSAKNYIRMLFRRLRKTLNQYEIDDILESRYGESRVNPDKFDCDYYQYLNGTNTSFHGIYMGDYSWAQEETAYLCKKAGL